MTTTTESQPTPRKEFTLRLPFSVWKAVEAASAVLSMSRSQFLIKSVCRNLDYVQKNELPLIEKNSRLQEALAVESAGGVR
jgi:uncharacterized protein (DUF1778 family)